MTPNRDLAAANGPISRRRIDLDDETSYAHDIIGGITTIDVDAFHMHPVHRAIARHDTKFAGAMRRTIGPESLHHDRVNGATIVRMHALEKERELCGRIIFDSKHMAQFSRPIPFARVEIYFEKPDFV